MPRIFANASITARRAAPALFACIAAAALTHDFAAAQDSAPSPVADALAKADVAVKAIVAVPNDKRNFDNTLGALDDMLANLRLDTEMIQFMSNVSTNAEERATGQKAEEDISNWLIELGKREDLYKAVKAFAAANPKLEGEQKRMLEFALRDYRRAGMDLPPDKREKLKQIEMETTRVGIEFDKNIRDDETRLPVTRDELSGMTDEYVNSLPRSGDLYLVGMDYPSYIPLTEQCDNENTRHKAFVVYKRRGGHKNIAVLEKMIKLRAEAAQLLGYASTGAYQTETRMAKNADAVWKFCKDLRPLIRKKAELDMAEFTAAKREHTKNPAAKMYPWDYSFYEKKLLQDKYQVDSEKVREYFPVEAVVNGLFSITQSLYGIEYKDVTAEAASRNRPLWHADVRLYEVRDKASGEILGEFYTDLYPRDGKFKHAACWGLAPRKVWSNGKITKPLAAMVCNFSKPVGDKPALLTHKEVETFFHEFGHCLHNILSEVKYGQFSGPAVARDFVEAPSQMFEHWVWDAKVLKTFARHYKTGEAFPDALLDGMIKAQKLGSGLLAERQFFYALTDFTYHTTKDGVVDTTAVQDKLFSEVEMYESAPETFYQAAFGHLNGYAAAYYGYMWSKVYAEDMFQRFRELGMLDPKAGMYYRKKVLARGGTVDEFEMLRDYLGREPKMDAFLEQLGLTAK